MFSCATLHFTATSYNSEWVNHLATVNVQAYLACSVLVHNYAKDNANYFTISKTTSSLFKMSTASTHACFDYAQLA